MSKHVEELVIARFLTMYGEPGRTDNPEAFIAEWVKAFTKVRPDILAEAVDRMVASHLYPTWPVIGELYLKVREVAEEREIARARDRKPEPIQVRKPPTEAEKQRVAKLIADSKRNLLKDADDPFIAVRKDLATRASAMFGPGGKYGPKPKRAA